MKKGVFLRQKIHEIAENGGGFFFFPQIRGKRGCFQSCVNAHDNLTTESAAVKKYRVPKIERPSAHRTLCMYGMHQCFLSRSRFTLCVLWRGDSLLWGNCQCSYTGTEKRWRGTFICMVGFQPYWW